MNRNMKTVKSIICLLAVFIAAGCDNSPIEEEQYQKIVYLTHAIDLVKDEYVNYTQEEDTIYVSVSVSGTLSPNKDIKVVLQEEEGLIEKYNQAHLSASVIQHRHLPQNAYQYPQDDVTIKAGHSMGLFPIYVNPQKLHCDSLYMLPFSIESVSDYEIRTKMDTVLLARINLINDYSGDYYMDGVTRKLDERSQTPYLTYRVLTATGPSTVRMYHAVNENLDNLQSSTMILTVNNQDHTVTMASWNLFELKRGGGTYLPDMKLYDIWYEYTSEGVDYRTEGFLYKVPKTELEQEFIDDWIRLERNKRNARD